MGFRAPAVGSSGALPSSVALGLNPRDVGPVLTASAAGWDNNMVEGPAVWWDEPRQKWGAMYAGYNAGTLFGVQPLTGYARFGVAWSDDLVTWAKDAANPVLSPAGTIGVDPDSGSLTGPFVLYEAGTYYLFYIGCNQKGYEQGTKTVCLATATSPLGPWTRRGAMVQTGAAPWCDSAVWRPNIVKVDGTYHMFVNGTKVSDTFERIGLATATSLLGPWTVRQTAVLDVGAPGSFESDHVADPSVYKAGDVWVMHYAGVDAQTSTQDAVAWCTSQEFPTTWRKHEDNPTLSVWTATSFSNKPAFTGGRPAIVNTPDGHYHFYMAGWPSEIRLAVQGAAVGVQTNRAARRQQWIPGDNGMVACNFDPADSRTNLATTAGFVCLAKVFIPDTTTVANIVAGVFVAGVGLTAGQCFAGLYQSDGSLIATTASQHTNWQASGMQSMALTSVQPNKSLKLPPGWVYVAFLANGTTVPQFSAFRPDNDLLLNVGLTAADGWRSAYLSTPAQVSMPATLGALSTWVGPVWAGLT